MKKKVLVVNNERKSADFGYYKNPVDQCLHSVPIEVLIALSKIGDYELLMIHHKDILNKSIDDFKPDAVITGGRFGDWIYRYSNMEREFPEESEFMLSTDLPYLGICGGHQICGVTHGSRFGPILKDGQPIREDGYLPVNIVKEDVLFKGLGSTATFMMGHRDELKTLPDNFELLASSDTCHIQAMRHKEKCMYGVQFHPEYFDEDHQNGIVLLKNFLSLI